MVPVSFVWEGRIWTGMSADIPTAGGRRKRKIRTRAMFAYFRRSMPVPGHYKAALPEALMGPSAGCWTEVSGRRLTAAGNLVTKGLNITILTDDTQC